jgi:hypothetical protein
VTPVPFTIENATPKGENTKKHRNHTCDWGNFLHIRQLQSQGFSARGEKASTPIIPASFRLIH